MSIIKIVQDLSLEESAKNNIKLAFSMAAKSYDTFALFQKEVAEDLMNWLSAISHQLSAIKILDIGCGTGFLAYSLTEKFPDAEIIACDISHAMVNVARDKNESCQWPVASGQNKKIHFLTADCGIVPCKNEVFDIITSNLTYQWLPNLGKAFSEVHRILKPRGLFIFSTLGTETLKELRYCYAEASDKFNKDGLPPFIGFAEKQALRSVLENAGFKNISIEIIKRVRTYPDMWALLKTMKSIGAGNPFKDGDKSLARGSILKKMAKVYEERFGVRSSESGVGIPPPTSHLLPPNHIYATYEVMFVHAEKQKT